MSEPIDPSIVAQLPTGQGGTGEPQYDPLPSKVAGITATLRPPVPRHVRDVLEGMAKLPDAPRLPGFDDTLPALTFSTNPPPLPEPPTATIRRLQARVSNQRRELRRLNKKEHLRREGHTMLLVEQAATERTRRATFDSSVDDARYTLKQIRDGNRLLYDVQAKPSAEAYFRNTGVTLTKDREARRQRSLETIRLLGYDAIPRERWGMAVEALLIFGLILLFAVACLMVFDSFTWVRFVVGVAMMLLSGGAFLADMILFDRRKVKRAQLKAMTEGLRWLHG